MFRGRILVVSDRNEVIAHLDPIIRDEGHLTLTVPNGEEVLRVFDEGIIPDVVISDFGPHPSAEATRYLPRFQQLNQLGQHLVVVDEGDHFPGEIRTLRGRLELDPSQALRHPFEEDRVRNAIQGSMDRIRRDLESLRGEMFREVTRMQKAIREAQLEMVAALALTMEAKDPYMRGHCERVADLARLVAEELKIEEEQVELLHTAALLHEIGKIGVSLEMLHKPGALTAEELAQIRAHPRVGAQIVSAVPSLRRTAVLIETQYTDFVNLSEHIKPTEPEFRLAAILRVVDNYDSMTSERAYREVLPRERWEAILRQGAGSQFHPPTVDAFFRVEARLGK